MTPAVPIADQRQMAGGASQSHDTAAEPAPGNGKERGSPLRVHAREAEQTTRLLAKLRGQRLPDLTLTTSDSMRLPLLSHVSGLVVLYFVPGENEAARQDGHPTPDASQHRGYVNRRDVFESMGVNVFCVSSQPAECLIRIGSYLEVNHLMFTDPELLLGRALGLPTLQHRDTWRYRRMALVTDGGRIQTVFGPLSDGQAAGSARQVLAWMGAAGVK